VSYFGAGLWHCGAALAFAAALGLLEHGDALSRLRDPLFVCALVVSSCALFPIPQAFARRGLWKFLHYPLPDWDVLLLGIASHRHWVSHSAWLPLLLAASKYLQPQFWAAYPLAASPALGLCLGLGSHLLWDLAGSRSHTIVVIPHAWTLRAATSRAWLLVGALLCLASAVCFSDLKLARAWLAQWL